MTLTKQEIKLAKTMNKLPFVYGDMVNRVFKSPIPACTICKSWWYAVLVIPNETRWECQKCGKCCTGMKGPDGKKRLDILDNYVEEEVIDGKVTFTPHKLPKDEEGNCLHRDKETNKCKIQDHKPQFCKIWPFHAIRNDVGDTVYLGITTLCEGYGKGKVITDEIYDKIVEGMKTYRQISDAFE